MNEWHNEEYVMHSTERQETAHGICWKLSIVEITSVPHTIYKRKRLTFQALVESASKVLLNKEQHWFWHATSWCFL
jgi:hypothetical protein